MQGRQRRGKWSRIRQPRQRDEAKTEARPNNEAMAEAKKWCKGAS